MTDIPEADREAREEEILSAAADVLRQRAERYQENVRWMVKQYCPKRWKQPHELGKPKKLQMEESLFLFALERNGYEVSGDCVKIDVRIADSGGISWSGNAFCRHNVQGAGICVGAVSRLDLLRSLWEAVNDIPSLTEEDLRGALRQRNIRAIKNGGLQ
jgi:hypothetical protein